MEHLIGREIVGIRWMTTGEQRGVGWSCVNPVPVLQLDDKTVLYPSRDYEGNGGGALFGAKPDGEFFIVAAAGEEVEDETTE